MQEMQPLFLRKETIERHLILPSMCPPRASHLHSLSDAPHASTHLHSLSDAPRASVPSAIHSGELPIRSALIRGWFHLARGRMRWRTGDTCLSAASCVPCPPPLAAIRKLSGTIPASPALLSGSSPRTPRQQKRQATSPAARLDPFTASRFPPPPPPQPGTPPSPHHSTPHTDQNGEPPHPSPKRNPTHDPTKTRLPARSHSSLPTFFRTCCRSRSPTDRLFRIFSYFSFPPPSSSPVPPESPTV